MKYKKCDVARWGKADHWEIMDAAQILADIEPLPKGHDVMYPRSASELLDRLVAAIKLGQLSSSYIDGDYYYFSPVQIIGWAQANAHPLPSGLVLEVARAAMRRDEMQSAQKAIGAPLPAPLKEQAERPEAGPLHMEGMPNTPPLSKRERQIRAIERIIEVLNFPPLMIPTGGKAEIEAECKRTESVLFGVGRDPFKKSWQEAVSQGRVRTERHDEYRGA